MVDDDSLTPPLRERKKIRTQAKIIDASLRLFVKQGYEQTTVAQIAAEADVGIRTFNNYFPTKDSVLAWLMEKVSDAVANEIAKLDDDVDPLSCLFLGHKNALQGAAKASEATFAKRFSAMIHILSTTPTLRTQAIVLRGHPIERVLASRMGVVEGDLQLLILLEVWGGIAKAIGAGLDKALLGTLTPSEACESAVDNLTVGHKSFAALVASFNKGNFY